MKFRHRALTVCLTCACAAMTLGIAGCYDTEQLQAFLRERLASYKVPRHVLFFREDEVALTGNAKIKAGELRELAAKRLAGN